MISGKYYAMMCRWNACPRYSDLPSFHYQFASHGDWVFVNGDYIDNFLRQFPMVSTKKFNIIVHNSDHSFGETQLSKLLRHAIHIYAINTIITHPKLTTIPIGFADRHLEFLKKTPPQPKPADERDYEIYCNFTISKERLHRISCLEAYKNDPRTVIRENRNTEEYYADLCRSKFVLCPDGTGIDTHRIYESILCGATPVVLRNSLSHLYERLPVCIVDKWTDRFYEVRDKTFSVNVRDYL